MGAAVVGHRDDRLGLELVVEPDGGGARVEPLGILDGDLVGCRSKAVDDLESGPMGRDAGVEADPVTAAVQAEDRLEDGRVEPGGGAGVPGPAPATDVGRATVEV